jgi:cyclin-Q
METAQKTNYYALAERNLTYASIKFILECCEKLEVKPTTFFHAATIYHRACDNLSHNENLDKFLLASSSIFVGSKINEEHIRLKDLIYVMQVTLNRDKWFSESSHESLFGVVKDSIVQCELFIMQALNFDTIYTLPCAFLLNYINTVENYLSEDVVSQTPIAKLAMSLLHDSYFNSNIITNYKSSEIAISMLVLTFQIYGIKLPLIDDCDTWYRLFCPDVKNETVWEIINYLLETYESEEK